tara:strand:- start:6570 stop:7895 length:1326 start_codon:yes stop_codon:yes gene_type:complete
MTKLTKNEKILRKASEKWKNFLAEGAFNQAQTQAPIDEARMGEYGKIDAEDGNPPTKIGRGNEEYMAAYNAVLVARGEEPLDIQKPDQAFLDALRSGQLEENEKKKFKVGEFVRIVAGSLKGATGKVIELVTTTTGEQGYVIELYSSAKMKVFGGPGDEVIATADEMESGGTTDGMELYDIDEKLSAADKEFHKSVMDKGKVPNLKGDMGPIPGLEGPFQYRSGAVLYYDPKAGKYYDRGKDMYLDNDEASRLIMEKDEKEFAKIFARAKDMLVLSARSRVPVSLKSVQSALDVIKMPSEMEKGKLIVKNEYVIADKDELPETAKQISFTKYAMDYLSNLPGEQLDLPMEEQERPDFVTSHSADPHLDQIEDYALTVIEKGGNLRQLEDVLNRDAFATFLKGDVLTIDDEFFVGNEENFEISPGEDVRRIKGSNLVVGRIS